ncbi:hypothetical protein F2P81_002026 [Scophthalmus maximus]|uniref:Adaptin ear-binding coat-associated protein 1 n=1 Tax=Scophthalmus maximus TaxID=52904 RepID=A0A6A4TFS9_SCOMX|nr:hypothetical protein F2P81_002026 [Scophthalmus maximus]
MATEGQSEYESVLCVKPEVNVYRIPPRASNRAISELILLITQPHVRRSCAAWFSLRCIHKVMVGKTRYSLLGFRTCTTGTIPDGVRELFAQAPVDEYPGITVETVSDSSRYFVLRIQDDNGRSAFIGIGFGDRGDAFDFNVALQDHFKWVKQEDDFKKQAQTPDTTPKLDLGFKEGQTITLNIGQSKKKDRSRPQSSGGFGLLPPPPGGKLAPPPSSRSTNHNTQPSAGVSDMGCSSQAQLFHLQRGMKCDLAPQKS